MSANDETAPMTPGKSTPAGSLGAGHMFGRYLIVDRVGAGGAGDVYAAYDPNLDRRVALKVLRGRASEDGSTSKPVGDEQDRAALVWEAQALAKLSHPNVVGVHDVGIVDDRTFIAMELVEGVDLSQWLQRQPKPGWRKTLAALVQAGRGLAAAHAKRTIHRDFKPANVLVGDDGRVRVTDFGLAQLLSPTQRAALDEPVRELSCEAAKSDSATLPPEQGLAGTPNYMAPEQHRGGAVSVRTDVYAFCLTAYEALFGQRPFADAPNLTALAQAKEARAPALPTSTPVSCRIRQAIIRGLDPDPSRRWDSMAPLLDRLQPRSSSRTSAVVMLATLGVVGAATAYVYGARPGPCVGIERYLDDVWDDARRDALHEVFVRGKPVFVADSGPRVEAAVDRYTGAWTEVRTGACLAAERGEHSQRWLDQTVDCLDRGRQRLDALLGVLLRGDVAATQQGLAAVQGLPAASACLDHDAGLARPSDPDLAAVVREQRARLAEVSALVRTGLHGEALPLAESVAGVAERSEYPPLRAEALYWLGKSQVKMGDAAAGEATLSDAVWIAHQSGHAQLQIEAAVYLTFVVGARRARFDEAAWWSRYAEAELDRTGGGPDLRAQLEHNRGVVALEAGDDDRAERALARAIELLAQADLVGTVRHASTLDSLGLVLRSRGAYDGAIEHHRRALAVRKAALGPEHPDVAASMSNLASVLVDKGEITQAEALHQRVLEIYENAYGPVHPTVAIALYNLGVSAFRQARAADAERYVRRAHEIRSETMPGHPKVASTLSLLATTVARQGRLEEAEALYAEVLAVQRGHAQPQELATTLNNLAGLYYDQHRYDQAAAAYREAVTLAEEQLGAEHPEIAKLLTNVGSIQRLQGHHQDALATLGRALTIAELNGEQNARGVAYALNELGAAQRAAGDALGAIATLERARPLAAACESAVDLQGSVEFELAKSLVDARNGGDEHARARALVKGAKARYEAAGGFQSRVDELDAWLASQPS